jgi:hypothetical protein
LTVIASATPADEIQRASSRNQCDKQRCPDGIPVNSKLARCFPTVSFLEITAELLSNTVRLTFCFSS